MSATFKKLSLAAVLLTLAVVVLGAWVRLSDAGLGCPDWPGCYGRIVVPQAAGDVAQANIAFPERPLEAHKGWKEMIHRYVAGMLMLLVFALAVMAWRQGPRAPRGHATAIAGLIVFQALLGMWTVTLLLKPVIVMGHLLGGMSTLALLWWLALRSGAVALPGLIAGGGMRWLAAAALVMVALQIALGGWTSANYAALACPDFPACQGQWWPAHLDFSEGFVLWRGLGVNYEYGVLEHPARTAIHLAHRLGALGVLLLAGAAGLTLLHARQLAGRALGVVILILMSVQLALGVANIWLALPLPVAAAHNGVAALLLLSLVTLNVLLQRETP
jgi:cytochrome c oxidase assembly protein subunit 15